MLDLVKVRDFVQNKNFVMFLASVIFMSGILAYFNNLGIVSAIVLTFILIILLKLKIFSVRQILVLAAVFYCGFFLTFHKIKTSDELLPQAPLKGTFTGRIVSIPNSHGTGKTTFFMETEKLNSKNISGKTYVTLNADKAIAKKLNIGEKVSLVGNLREPFSATNPSQFDYGKYLRNFNTFTVIYSEDNNLQILKDKPTLKWKFLKGLNNTRISILETHSKYLKSPNLEILGGIVFGEDAVAPPEYIKNSFLNSGLLHILAASGMNVAFIFSFWFVILKLLRVPYKPRVLSGMLLVILYTLMTGLGPSVIRAALMLLFVLAGKLIDRDTHSVSLLAFVAVLMLIYNPAYINNVSFQLSFLVTLGLLTTANVFTQKLDKIPSCLSVPVLIPLVAQIWIAPIQMFYFNTFSVYSILANISTVCLLSVISFCGFVSSLLSVISPIADIVCRIFDFFLNYFLNILVRISEFFANLPHCLLQTSHPNIFQIMLYYLTLISVTFLVKCDKYKYACITCFALGMLLVIGGIRPISHDLEIIAFDVQNADSFLIKTPKDKYFVIDTGKAPYKSGNSQAKIIMLKYLKDRGIKDIEGVIVTHFDSDHSGGTCDFIENTNIKTVYLNSYERNTETAKKIFNMIEKHHQNMKIVKDGSMIYSEPDFEIRTYKADIENGSTNENSTISLVSYKNFDMLFMGDAGVQAFNVLKQKIPYNVEVLKVGHHGGAGVVDSDMINHLGNKVSLISTGINYFGHPSRGTLDILRNTEILRTDILNSVKISTDGNFYKIYAYEPHDKKYKFKEIFESNQDKNF